ncbi:MAG: serine hydrolase [Saprospiraceae bacterium]|nr:serine hydrolase [Saprospiraceae bacterium]
MRCTSVLLLLLLARSLTAQDYGQKLRQLDDYIERARQQWEVPGLAVAVVKEGQNLWCKGYGNRNIGHPEAVDVQTLFAICSTTKAMTAACMSMLIDEGKVAWEDQVVDILPNFQLSDPRWTKEIRVRDLFTHNTGMGNADLLWYLWDYEPDIIMEKMKYVDPAYPLRGGYTYQNNMYAVAGQVIEKISGKPWQEFIQERIFVPLKMTNTFPTQKLSLAYVNRSSPHSRYQGKVTAFADESADQIAPAGAVWSTIEDMQKWMQFVLDSARVDGQRLISQENYQEWLKPQTIVSDAGFYPTQRLTKPHWKTYALGWFQHDYHGRAVSFHTGSLQGTIAIIGLIPDEHLGVYVFGNLDHAEVRHAIMYKVFDIFGEHDDGRDWSSEFLELYQETRSNADTTNKVTVQILPSYALQDFLGTYEDSYLGDIEIKEEDGTLVLLVGPKDKAKLISKNRNTFNLQYISRPYMTTTSLTFEDDGDKIIGFRYFNRFFKKKNSN